ncbi:hypothetical protein [Lewinella sp. W8]|uniref:hypothetical protein n=1 Tax=Lewinella sp. W8 TaxID=2528208 RepID=UPI001067B989|nr:hypothetical protein [Lewinella sp. W8]MTB53071.1 hypothetical protein [Lewinella sp. W8]
MEDNTLTQEENRTVEQIENEILFGRTVKWLNFFIGLAHVVSFLTGCNWGLAWANDKSETWGIVAYFGEEIAMIFGGVIALTISSVIELMHHVIPPITFWLAFMYKKTFRSFPRAVLFVFLAAMLVGITLLSRKTSAGGAEAQALAMHDAPEEVDLSDLKEDFQADTLNIRKVHAASSKAIELSFGGKADSIASIYTPRIEKERKTADRNADLDSKVHPWAPGDAKARRLKADILEQEMRAKIRTVEAAMKVELAKVESEAARELSEARASYNGNAQKRENKFDQEEAEAKAATEKRVQDWTGGTNFAVWLIVFGIFLREFYKWMSGREYEGIAWNDEALLGKLLGNIGGIFHDKLEHLVQGAEATRAKVADRGEAKPWSIPRLRTVNLAFAFAAFLFGITQTVIPEVNNFRKAGDIFPYPWNFGFLAVAMIYLFDSVRKYRNGKDTKTRSGHTPNTNSGTAKNTDTKSKPEQETRNTEEVKSRVSGRAATPESVVPRGFQQNTDTDTDFDLDGDLLVSSGDEEEISSHDLEKLKKACRRSYERSETNATDTGRASARKKFLSRAKTLRRVGISVKLGPGKRRVTKNRKGKVKTYTFDKLHIE